jgi:ATP synthase protein I
VTAPPTGPARPVAPWDLSHLRWGLAATALLAVGGVPLAWALRGGKGAAWVAVGLAIVAVFFSAGALAVAAAGRIGDELTLPAALGSYLVKIVLFGVLLVAVRGKPWLDPPALGLSVLVGTLTWTTVHGVRVWRSRIFYVDP